MCVATLLCVPVASGEQIKYRGSIVTKAGGFDGMGFFKFVLIDPTGNSVWSNDGKSVAGREPAGAVQIPVKKGIYRITLGDESTMSSIPNELTLTKSLRLRVWFSADGRSFEKLVPDQSLKVHDSMVLGAPQQVALSSSKRTEKDASEVTFQNFHFGFSRVGSMKVRVPMWSARTTVHGLAAPHIGPQPNNMLGVTAPRLNHDAVPPASISQTLRDESRDSEGGLDSSMSTEPDKEEEEEVVIESEPHATATPSVAETRPEDLVSPSPHSLEETTRSAVTASDTVVPLPDNPSNEGGQPAIGVPPVQSNVKDTISVLPHLELSDGQPKEGLEVKLTVSAEIAGSGKTISDRDLPLTVYLIVSQQLTTLERIDSRTLTIPQGVSLSEKVAFKLRIEKTNDRLAGVINAFFFHKGYPCGRVTMYVPITRSDDSSVAAISHGVLTNDTVDDLITVPLVTDGPDLTVSVISTDEGLHQRYQCFVITPKQGEDPNSDVNDWPLRLDAKKFLKTFFASYSKDADPQNVRAGLNTNGKKLYESAPSVFKQRLWKLFSNRALPKNILLFSEEPDMPWELMIPHQWGKTLQPLGVMAAFARWGSYHQEETLPLPLHRFQLDETLVWAPVYPQPLKNSAIEAKFIQDNMHGKAAPGTFNGLCNTLTTSPATVLHFVCHGVSNQDGEQSIAEEGPNSSLSWISADRLAGRTEFQAFCARRPLVFLNACNVGTTIDTLTGVGGFAPSFIDLKAGGIIAPLWSVFDGPAEHVAEEFYKAARENPKTPLAESIRSIRSLAYYGPPVPGLATYAAYCFYGDPLATPQ